MKLTVKKLSILTVITFLFSPIISPWPGLILLISTAFLWLSEQINKIPGEEVCGEEEDKNESEVTDRGDHIVIIEKRVINKKDLTYDDFRKYGIKNINCVKDCISFKAPDIKNHYKADHKHCLVCNIWMLYNESNNCPCCSSALRVSPNT